MRISVSKLYETMPQVSGMDTTGQNVDWLRACVNEFARPGTRLTSECTDIQKLLAIAVFLKVPGTAHISMPKMAVH